MVFKAVDQSNIEAVKRSTRSLRKAAEYAEELRDRLVDLFANRHAKEEWGVLFFPDVEGLGAALETPYGPARAASVNVVANGKVQIRYVIEKAITLANGNLSYTPVWDVLIDDDGEITSGDGLTKYASLNSFEDAGNRSGIGTIGLSMLYAIGADLSRV